MKVIHCMFVYAGSEKATYAAHVSECRWTDRARGKWTGRVLHETGARISFPASPWNDLVQPERVAALNNLARTEAARLGLPAGPDNFPFS